MEAESNSEVKVENPEVIAKEAGLRYVTDTKPGFSRERNGEKYIYYDSKGGPIENEKVITRINKLIIPHVWNNVWICPYANGHLQATGFDAKNRKQYRYHKEWDRVRNEKKFDKMLRFGEVLPQIRKTIQLNLTQKTLSKEKVLSTVISLLDDSLIRIGNREYARTNKTYGLTTLRDKHVKSIGSKVELEFVGKKNIEKKILVSDKKLASIIKKCKELPGYDLFQYYDDDGEIVPVGSEDVNAYLKELTGEDITAKDFRTWGGSSIAIKALLECEPCEDEKTIKKNITEAIKKVSGCLGNTPTVCKGYYVHPIIIEKYSAQEIMTFAESHKDLKSKGSHWLSFEEKLFLEMLR